jgi:hypothetical protein
MAAPDTVPSTAKAIKALFITSSPGLKHTGTGIWHNLLCASTAMTAEGYHLSGAETFPAGKFFILQQIFGVFARVAV